ncbi:hypothetical protein ACJO2E_02395 [Marinobacter sp. M1N3S26]|uniref:hypothetical protein n=1 Tax=Marinobacter sp. M1N3S26 TaxID=3382299 RepID=UPI00387A9781
MNGIGGRTITEAKQRMPYVEFLAWAAYRKRRGSLNPNQHIERAGALVATILSNVNRKKDTQPFSFYDFAPHHDEPPISLERAMEVWH